MDRRKFLTLLAAAPLVVNFDVQGLPVLDAAPVAVPVDPLDYILTEDAINNFVAPHPKSRSKSTMACQLNKRRDCNA